MMLLRAFVGLSALLNASKCMLSVEQQTVECFRETMVEMQSPVLHIFSRNFPTSTLDPNGTDQLCQRLSVKVSQGSNI